MNKKFLKGFAAGLFLAFILSTFILWLMIRDRKLNIPYGRNAMTVRLDDIQDYIDQFYLNDYVDEDLYNGAYKGYVEGLGDKYSAFYPKRDLQEVKDELNSNIVGIGVYMTIDSEENRPKITKAIAGEGAAKNGVEEGDILLEIDGTDTLDMPLEVAEEMLQGYGATTVSLKIKRGTEELTIDVKRRAADIIYVEQKMLDNNVGYVKIYRFDGATVGQFSSAVDELTENGAKALIIDLRGNPGGDTNATARICDRFLEAGKLVMYAVDKKGRRDEYKSSDDVTLDIPVAFLMDKGSASSSEVMVGCLKYYLSDSKIFGETSFGKGIMQTTYLMNGGSIKLTTAYWYTPDGVCIHHKGFEPDFPVEDDPETENDEVIDEAVKYLATK